MSSHSYMQRAACVVRVRVSVRVRVRVRRGHLGAQLERVPVVHLRLAAVRVREGRVEPHLGVPAAARRGHELGGDQRARLGLALVVAWLGLGLGLGIGLAYTQP